MPIYAYRCSSCGHTRDVLRKISDPALTTCPACNAETFTKQLTAAGFQLKGSGWYVTDFKGGGNGASAPAVSGVAAGAAADGGGGAKPSSGDGSGGSTPAAGGGAGAAGAAGSTGGSSSAAAATCGGSCACH
jgi:putative FmdB family regulatory protein